MRSSILSYAGALHVFSTYRFVLNGVQSLPRRASYFLRPQRTRAGWAYSDGPDAPEDDRVSVRTNARKAKHKLLHHPAA